MYLFPVSATVITRTIQALPITTPSMVSPARNLLARKASIAKCQFSDQLIAGFAKMAPSTSGVVTKWDAVSERHDAYNNPLHRRERPR
jgi:hypothetical protein